MSSDQMIKVWVRLVDQNGNSFKGCTADEYTIESNANISNLRKAIKAENPNMLAQFDSSDLKVYKNEDDLRGKNHSRSSHLVIGLGKTEENSLLVLVPDDSEPIMKKPKISGSNEPSSFVPFDTDSLLPPNEVSVTPFLESNEPPFIAQENWLENVTHTICENMMSQDGGQRVPLMAFVRCSLGGKTRALKELGVQLKKITPQAAIIYVSMNDRSELEPWEQDDPTAALCRRIAFAAQKNLNIRNFKSMKNVVVTKRQITTWLGDSPCVLLVDDMNLIRDLNGTAGSSEEAIKMAFFLKKNFLIFKGRYFVFSSNSASTVASLAAYLDRMVDRPVLAPELPLIPNLLTAVENFELPDLNQREAIYFGNIPAMIYQACKKFQPYLKQGEAISACSTRNLVTDHSVENLLQSFITGDRAIVLPPLLQLMDAWRERGKVLTVKWIPFHMMEVLFKFSYVRSLDKTTAGNLRTIVTLFNKFKSAKENSGEGWEALFVIVLLIRCMAYNFQIPLLPILSDFEYDSSFSVSLNENLDIVNETFGDIITCDALIDKMKIPNHLPHISIYYPTHAQFQDYDVIVAVYRSANHRRLYGYQLKEGKGFPTADASISFTKSFVIRGDAGSEPKYIRGWKIASANEIDEFFGESGRNWTPMKWKQMTSK